MILLNESQMSADCPWIIHTYLWIPLTSSWPSRQRASCMDAHPQRAGNRICWTLMPPCWFRFGCCPVCFGFVWFSALCLSFQFDWKLFKIFDKNPTNIHTHNGKPVQITPTTSKESWMDQYASRTAPNLKTLKTWHGGRLPEQVGIRSWRTELLGPFPVGFGMIFCHGTFCIDFAWAQGPIFRLFWSARQA